MFNCSLKTKKNNPFIAKSEQNKNNGMGSKKKYKINKQTTYLLLYYQEINMVHKQNKEKKMKEKNFYYTKKKQNNPTHTNSQNSKCGHLFSHNHTHSH